MGASAGVYQATMPPPRAVVILLVLASLAAMVAADEGDATTVEDLGAALGRRGNRYLIRRTNRIRGNRGSFGGGVFTNGYFELNGFQGNHEEDKDEVSSQADELGESRSPSQKLGEIIDTEMASSRETFSPAAREMILRIFKKVQGCRASSSVQLASHKTSTQPAVSSSSKGKRRRIFMPSVWGMRKGKRKGRGSRFDWTQCKSEGGAMNCALCSDVKGGALPCNKARMIHGRRRSHAVPGPCSDDKIMETRKFWYLSGSSGVGGCLPLDGKAAIAGYAKNAKDKFPIIGKLDKSMVFTKVWITHPHYASRPVGVVLFKRLVSHTCTGVNPSSCKQGTTVFDVHKVGYCIKCHYNVFSEKGANNIKDSKRRSFVRSCLPRAIDKNGKIKPTFRCSKKDEKYALNSISSF